jgi:Amidase
MKDLFDFKPGWPTTFGGVRAFRDFVPDFYCAWAERMEAAGAIILGKTNSPVMGFRGTCDNYLVGPTRNPFDPSRNSGGSSGGSAAAVADGMLPLAEGTGRLRTHPRLVVRGVWVQAIFRTPPLHGPAQRLQLDLSLPLRELQEAGVGPLEGPQRRLHPAVSGVDREGLRDGRARLTPFPCSMANGKEFAFSESPRC